MNYSDTILVVDVECTCWDKQSEQKVQTQEIIEIGVCPVGRRNLNIVEPRSIIVRPQNSTISKFCTGLTGITQEDVEIGLTFQDACNALKNEFLSANTCLASWGDFDRRQFEKDCELYGVEYPFGKTHLNIKYLHALWKNRRRGVGLAEALKGMDMQFEGKQHSAKDDAYNAAKILVEIIGRMRN